MLVAADLTHHVLAAYETLSEGVKTPREIMADKVEELSQQVLTDVAAELVAAVTCGRCVVRGGAKELRHGQKRLNGGT